MLEEADQKNTKEDGRNPDICVKDYLVLVFSSFTCATMESGIGWLFLCCGSMIDLIAELQGRIGSECVSKYLTLKGDLMGGEKKD